MAQPPPPPPPPIATEDPSQPILTPAGPPIETLPPVTTDPNFTPVVPVGPPDAATLPPDEVTEEVVATLSPLDEANLILTKARTDLDLLAFTQLGNDRPQGWSGISDLDNPQLAILIRLDLEILANTLLGQPPSGWFGVVNSTPYAIARDIRHDLDLLAEIVGQPVGWIGDAPIMQCSRATQTLVDVMEAAGVFVLTADPNADDFCRQAEIEASRFAEINLLAGPVAGANPLTGPATINSDFAVGFLDRGASQRVGVIPRDTSLTPVGRSPAQFSNMMLVTGDNFAVFVDYQFTTFTREEYNELPSVDGIEITPFCGADWCGG
jgi:hypothetical protein